MAKKNQSAAPATNGAAAPSKSQKIRDYHVANPTATPSEIAKALTDGGTKVSTSHVSSVLADASPKIDVETVKKASAFVKSFDGDLAQARESISAVGSFVEECGSAKKALAAIETLESLSSLMG